MKLKNSPERKRQRQLKALENLGKRDPKEFPYKKTNEGKHELEVLEIRTASNLRHGRTKKFGPRKKGRRKSDL